MVDITDLFGCNFKNHGRSVEEGFDCYGLAIEVSRRLGHELKDVWYTVSNGGTFGKLADSVLQEMSKQLKETEEQKLGNLIVFKDEHGMMIHIGVILEEGRFIHADVNGVWVNTIEDYFRKDWKVYEWLT